MPARPTIQLLVPRHVVPGTEAHIEALVEAKKATKADSVSISLEGQQWIRCGHCGGLHPRGKSPEVTLEAEVRSAGELEPGSHRFSARFLLDRYAQHTYSAEHSYFQWTARCRVDIPWWPDAKAEARVHVVPPPAARAAPRPLVVASHRDGDAPYVEATLEDRVFAQGDVIRGSIAVGDLHGRLPIELTYALMKHETAGPHWRDTWRRKKTHRAVTSRRWIDPAGVIEGGALPIELHVPALAMPSIPKGYSVSIEHFVSICVRTKGASTAIDVPIELRWLAGERAASAPAKVGDARWRDVWAGAASLGESPLRVAPDRLALEGRIGEIDAVLAPAEDGSLALALELAWSPRWGLGLSIKPRRVARLWGDELERRHAVRARDPRQLEVVLTSLRTLLCKLDRVSMDDDRLRARFEVPSFEATEVGKVIHLASELAEAIEKARASTPPPAALADALPAWQAAAAAYGARLVVGAMALELDDPGLSSSLATRFEDDRPVGTSIEACLHPPLDHAPDPSDRALAPALESLRAAGELGLDEHGVRLTLPSPTEDPRTISALLDRVRSLAHELRGQTGPYR